MSDNLDQGSQTQSDPRATWDSNQGLAGPMEIKILNYVLKINLFGQISQMT